jgi:predicted MPP superfamily phosphohydrolase
MRKALVAVGLLALIILVLCAVMVRNADAAPVQRDLTVELDGLPQGTRPLKLVLMSDFHVGNFGNTPERFRETARRVTALQPDVILLGGDFVSTRMPGGSPVGRFLGALDQMKARLGIFAVLGDHDYGQRSLSTRALLEHGVLLRNNKAARAGPLAIVGIGDAHSGAALVPFALRRGRDIGGVPVVFTHSPDVVPQLPPDIELVLAGHTHCGQVVLPFLGALETSSRYGRRYACGVIREGKRTTIVTSGLGVSRLPFRFGAPPDFWVITIVPRQSGRG